MRLHSKYTLPSFDPSTLCTSCVYATSASPSLGGSGTCGRTEAAAAAQGTRGTLVGLRWAVRYAVVRGGLLAHGHVEVLQLDELHLAVGDDRRAVRQQRADQRVLRGNKTTG